MMMKLITAHSGLNYRKYTSLSKGVVLLFALLLSACGGGEETASNPDTTPPSPSGYSGPPAATADIQAYKLNVWDNLSPLNRCGTCHIESRQSPQFVRTDDINLAYAAANSYVDLTSPADSTMVTKVRGGHNCWLASDDACGDIIEAYITAWAGNGSGSSRGIDLDPPPLRTVGDSKSFPGTSTLFQATVYPVLTANCAGCHSESSPNKQSPFFANADVDSAYEAAKQKINLDTPANSRFVLRLDKEFHNCWSGNCTADAVTMQTAIEAFSNGITPTVVDPTLHTSRAMRLVDGVVAAGGDRYEADQIALWEFKTGQGTTVYDTSGVEPGINLALSGDYNWVGGYGIEFRDGKAQAATADSKKLHDLIRATGEYTIEAWVVPGNVTQEDSHIISYSGGTDARNFTLAQRLYSYEFLQRSTTTDANGEPLLITDPDDEDLQATQQHVVITSDPVNGRRIYVNGVFTDDIDATTPGSLVDWQDSFAFVLGNEISGDRSWAGKLRLTSVHNRALSQAQITQNFDAGVGEKFYLLFSISHLVNVPDSYILFEVSQFDNYSYLFYRPTYINLDTTVTTVDIPIQSIRLGINGKEAVVGQAFVNLDTDTITSNGQVLSTLGTIIELEKGVDDDDFFLTFAEIGTNTRSYTEPAPTPPSAPADLNNQSDIGIRTFDEINALMSEVTGVSTTQSDVNQTFTTIKQQLPTVERIQGFLSAHQVGIAQLAIEYCNALVDDVEGDGDRTNFFGAFAFNSPVTTAFDGTTNNSAEKLQIADALYDKMVGIPSTPGVDEQANAPTRAQVRDELIDTVNNPVNPPVSAGNLFDRLTGCPGSCSGDAARTRVVVKAMCASVLSSAAILLQ